MEDFTRKAHLVAGGHKTDSPATITYASVVSRETVRIALLMAALNDLKVKAGDVLIQSLRRYGPYLALNLALTLARMQ